MNVNMGVATESKMMVGSETEMAGVMEKLKVKSGLEAGMVVGMESGVDTEVGTNSKSMVDMSGNISAGSAIMTIGGDAGVDTQSMVAGTNTRDNAAAVAGVEVHTIAEGILSVCGSK